MNVPCVVFGDEPLFAAMDDMVAEQSRRVASLPGIVRAAYAMPDAHWGYGFPIGGVAAFDAQAGGVVSAGGVGFDIACGVRCLTTGLTEASVLARQAALADALYAGIPAGVGSTGAIRLDDAATDAMLTGGARWALEQGYGEPEDLLRTEEQGCMPEADPGAVSTQARQRQRDEMGTLGSGNHYLEVQVVRELHDASAACAYGLRTGEVVVMIHCGSRGLGHQIGSEFLLRMASEAPGHGLVLPDRELACAPIESSLGQSYLGAMRSAINCALANRQILTHRAREIFMRLFPHACLQVLYDVSHNTCKVEEHWVDGALKTLHVHRKGATRAWGPGHPGLAPELRDVGQPVLIGGSMGTGSYILAGMDSTGTRAFASACHGAGRAMSRHAAQRTWRGRSVQDQLARQGIIVRSPSLRGIAEEAPGAYKDVAAVVAATERAGLARSVARLSPLVCIKG